MSSPSSKLQKLYMYQEGDLVDENSKIYSLGYHHSCFRRDDSNIWLSSGNAFRSLDLWRACIYEYCHLGIFSIETDAGIESLAINSFEKSAVCLTKNFNKWGEFSIEKLFSISEGIYFLDPARVNHLPEFYPEFLLDLFENLEEKGTAFEYEGYFFLKDELTSNYDLLTIMESYLKNFLNVEILYAAEDLLKSDDLLDSFKKMLQLTVKETGELYGLKSAEIVGDKLSDPALFIAELEKAKSLAQTGRSEYDVYHLRETCFAINEYFRVITVKFHRLPFRNVFSWPCGKDPFHYGTQPLLKYGIDGGLILIRGTSNVTWEKTKEHLDYYEICFKIFPSVY